MQFIFFSISLIFATPIKGECCTDNFELSITDLRKDKTPNPNKFLIKGIQNPNEHGIQIN